MAQQDPYKESGGMNCDGLMGDTLPGVTNGRPPVIQPSVQFLGEETPGEPSQERCLSRMNP